jgi:DedD protein
MAAGNNGDLDSVPVQTEQPAQKPVQKPKPVEKPQPKPQRDTTSEQLAAATETPPAKPAADEKPAPTGKAYVVQLGALKNADKVNEVVAKLRGAGYRVYTSPSTPVQGKITRILVGPDASRDKLKGSLGELNQLSGLSGVVMSYSAN